MRRAVAIISIVLVFAFAFTVTAQEINHELRMARSLHLGVSNLSSCH